MIYDLIAPFYDSVNRDVDYVAWADFIEKVSARNPLIPKPELVLDLGCGTGKMTLELASRGYDMTGVDLSVEMLHIAKTEAEQVGLGDKILWLSQDMRAFELYGTVDLAVSCLDTLNHLTDTKSLRQCLRLVHNYLIPNGLFIFDVNGKGKFERIYSNNTYVMEEGGDVCVWENYYSSSRGICDFYITLFSECEDGRYERHEDVEREKMYTLRSLKTSLAECGFEFIGAYSDFEFTEATDDDERIYVVARCIKKGI
ncbi:MAG: class I SAM-dependent methyltransferase [Clostridia bacterium]|nr:class I SAM-dependent methyltransferase [Clostridia bacterium]